MPVTKASRNEACAILYSSSLWKCFDSGFYGIIALIIRYHQPKSPKYYSGQVFTLRLIWETEDVFGDFRYNRSHQDTSDRNHRSFCPTSLSCDVLKIMFQQAPSTTFITIERKVPPTVMGLWTVCPCKGVAPFFACLVHRTAIRIATQPMSLAYAS